MDYSRRTVLAGLPVWFSTPLIEPLAPKGLLPEVQLVRAARSQIGVTTSYDGAYQSISYPGGDVPIETGVCIDVVIRAYRAAFGVDFQKLIHEDMRANFSAYPRIWGLTRTDRNIDHRRVPNVETYLKRRGFELPANDWKPGDIISMRLGNRLPHIAILSSKRDRQGRPLGVHNIGAGTREEPVLGRFDDERRFRFLKF
ncbi:MAG: DUF1287 domain-containing protein [Pseudomonadota bacterium]